MSDLSPTPTPTQTSRLRVREPDAVAKAATYVAGATLVLAVLAPVRQNWRRPPRDGFPLSYYPMFTARRRRTGSVTHLVGVDPSGDQRILHHRHLGSGGLNQVRRQVRRMVKAGHAQAVATAAAASVARSARPADDGVAEVRVVTSSHAYDAFFAGDRVPRTRTVHASAPVVRPDRSAR